MQTASMQNGIVGVMGDCIHTSVIQISHIQALNLHSIAFHCRPICLDISARQSGASRNRGEFPLKPEGLKSYSRFRGQACGYSHPCKARAAGPEGTRSYRVTEVIKYFMSGHTCGTNRPSNLSSSGTVLSCCAPSGPSSPRIRSLCMT